MIQTILHILARQMRLLGQQVEIKVSDLETEEDMVRTKKSEGGEPKKKDKKGDTAQKVEKTEKKDAEKIDAENKDVEKKDAEEKAEPKSRDKSAEKGEKAGKTSDKKDKAQGKDKGKADKEAQKEEKGSKKEKTSGKSAKGGKDAGAKVPMESGSSISISEVERKNEKVLVVEKGYTTRPDAAPTRVGSIEVVTLSQFAILEEAVNELKQKTGPIPPISLPDNQKLRTDIARGSATLTDTMKAMQVTARVKAAEQAIGRMAGLLTQLAAVGALPEDLVDKVTDVKFDIERLEESTVSSKSRPTTAGSVRKMVAIDPSADRPEGRPEGRAEGRASVLVSTAGRPSVGSLSRPSILNRASQSAVPPVTHTELSDAMLNMRTELMKNITNMTTRATTVAETASNTARSVADRLDVAMNLDRRITTLYSLVSDYAEQLSGFDAGLVTSMQSFQEQMAQLRDDLKNGLGVMDQANNNGETAAVKELTERCEGLASDLEQTIHDHQDLVALQGQLGNELKSLVECVEMLREQKADRDEVLDGLRDKADTCRLSGLLHEEQFAEARGHLEDALHACHDKFQRQDAVWMNAIHDLSSITESKAEVLDLLSERDTAQRQLRELDEKLYQLAVQLGEPKAALLTRALSRSATCGACAVAALMEPTDVTSDAPPHLPALRPPPDYAAHFRPPCKPAWMNVEPSETGAHVCRRWVGGSHTLVTIQGGVVTREQAPLTQLQTTPTRQYTGYGNDGRLYMMEEELQPCGECNKLGADPAGGRGPVAAAPGPAPDAAGDRGPRPSTILIQ